MNGDVAALTHDVPGRLRYRIEARRGDRDFYARIGAELLKCEMVQSVEINPMTGSVLVIHVADPEAITRYAEQHGLFRLGGKRPAPSTDMAPPDMRSLLPPLLIGLGLYQIAQGNVLAPAVSLFWYAFSLLNADTNQAVPAAGENTPAAAPKRTGGGRKVQSKHQQQGDSDG